MHPTLLLIALCAAAPVVSQRGADPVTVSGSEVQRLVGHDPSRIVGFRWNGGWEQIPIQVDERAIVRFDQIRNTTGLAFESLVFTDPSTFTGPDPDPAFDADDEISFMARHTGAPAGFGDPQGTIAGSRVALTITDPLSSQTRYAYLYVTDGSLDSSAGQDLVGYVFDLASGDYLTTYNTNMGPNPERSRVVTRDYRIDFRDRWILDRANVYSGTATGVDILDRVKFQFGPGICSRTTSTFSHGPGAIIANIDGPVRAIRSVFGANSGRLTQRDWICYESHVLMRTHLRVHPIGGTWTFLDYSEQAVGMTYRDSLNPTGVTIDGQPDPIATGVLDWQMVTGPQGTLTTVHLFETDIPPGALQRGSHYFDDLSPSWSQCSGDATAYAASGPATGPVANTDPLRGPANQFELEQFLYFDAPGSTVADAESRLARARTPFGVRAQPDYSTFGSGCPSPLGVPTLELAGVPEPGGSVFLAAHPLPDPSVGTFWFGASNSTWNGAPLPLRLDDLGFPGCSILVSFDIPGDTPIRNGRAEIRIDIPNDPALAGATLQQQFVGAGTSSGTLGIWTSSGGTLTLGG